MSSNRTPLNSLIFSSDHLHWGLDPHSSENCAPSQPAPATNPACLGVARRRDRGRARPRARACMRPRSPPQPDRRATRSSPAGSPVALRLTTRSGGTHFENDGDVGDLGAPNGQSSPRPQKIARGLHRDRLGNCWPSYPGHHGVGHREFHRTATRSRPPSARGTRGGGRRQARPQPEWHDPHRGTLSLSRRFLRNRL